MALANYADLLVSLANWSKRTDLTDIGPDLVTLAEARIARDVRVRAMVFADTLQTVAGDQKLALQGDYLETKNIVISSTTPACPLSFMTPEHLSRAYPANYQSGQPTSYTVVGSDIWFGPTPDDVYDVAFDYYAKLPGLQANSENWLMTNAPGVYLSACMAELSVFTLDDPTPWNAKYGAEVAALHSADEKATHSGSSLRVRNN